MIVEILKLDYIHSMLCSNIDLFSNSLTLYSKNLGNLLLKMLKILFFIWF